MKYAKMLGLLVAAAAVLMAACSSAYADTLTGPNGESTPTFHGVSPGHVKLSNPVAAIECPSTAEGTVTKHEAGKKVYGTFSSLTFGHTGNACTGGWVVTVITSGELSVEYTAPGEGTVFSTGATVIAHRLGITCNYLTNTTDVGTFTDHTKSSNGLASIDINGQIPIHSGSSALCGTAPGKWSGTYSSTTKLTIHHT